MSWSTWRRFAENPFFCPMDRLFGLCSWDPEKSIGFEDQTKYEKKANYAGWFKFKAHFFLPHECRFQYLLHRHILHYDIILNPMNNGRNRRRPNTEILNRAKGVPNKVEHMAEIKRCRVLAVKMQLCLVPDS